MLEIDLKGAAGEVWACVDGVGLFRSDDHGATWSQKKKTYDILTFAISPHDRKRILIAGARSPKRMEPQITIDGGATWSTIATLPFPGQPEAFHSLIQDTHAYYIFHATDPMKVFAARYQHFGRSTDGGQTFVWASTNFDYNFVYDIAVDPADWTQMALAMQDRILVFTENGHAWVWDDAVGEEVKAEIERQAEYTNHTGAGRGALILRNGTHRRIISGAGNGVKQLTLIHTPEGRQSDRHLHGARPRRQGRLVRGRRQRRQGRRPRLHRALALRPRGGRRADRARRRRLRGDRRRQRRRRGLRRQEEQRRGHLALDRLRRDLDALGDGARALPADRQQAGARRLPGPMRRGCSP